MMIAVGVVSVPTFARLAHGQVLSVREKDFVQAARCIGVRDVPIMVRHILPNVLGSIIVIATTLEPAMMPLWAIGVAIAMAFDQLWPGRFGMLAG